VLIKKIMKKLLALIIIISFSVSINGQNIKKIDSLKQVYNQQNVDSTKINLANKIGNFYMYHKYDTAMFYFQKAVTLSKKIHNKNNEAISLFNLAFLQLLKREYGNSIKNFDASKVIFEKQQNKLMIAKVYNNLSFCYSNLFSEDIAFEYLIKSLNIFKELKNNNGIYLNYSDIGTLFYNQKNYDFAKKYYTRALNTSVILKDSSKIAICYLNLGNAVSDDGNIKKGLEFYKKSLAIATALNDQNNIATNYNNIADTYKVLKNYKKSNKLFDKALVIAKHENNSELIAIIYLNKSELAHLLKLESSSIAYAKKSQLYGYNNLMVRLENFKNLSDANYSLGKILKSYQYLKKYTSLKDSLNEINQQKTIKLFKTLNELETSNSKVSKLSNENGKIKSKSENEKKFIYGLIVAMVIFGVLIILLNFQYAKKQEAFNLLKYKNFKINTMNDEIEGQKNSLEKLNRAKDKLFSIIGHDLKNPFNSIKGFTDLLIENSDVYTEDKKIKFLEIISKSSEKASELLNNLLLWAKSQSGTSKYYPEELNLNEQIDNVAALIEAQALSKDIKIKTNLKSSFFVKADKNMLNTILRNLMSNAVKFTNEKGLIEITALENENKIEIEVKDNGVGIPKENFDNLFSLDTKKSTQGTGGEQGSGLGLLLVKEFVKNNNGELTVTSEVNKGSSFKFTLPKLDRVNPKIKLAEQNYLA